MSSLVVISSDELRQLVTEAVSSALKKEKTKDKQSLPSNSNTELVTKKQAAAILKVSLSTIDNYIKEGLLTRKKVGSRFVRLDVGEVKRLAKSK